MFDYSNANQVIASPVSARHTLGNALLHQPIDQLLLCIIVVVVAELHRAAVAAVKQGLLAD